MTKQHSINVAEMAGYEHSVEESNMEEEYLEEYVEETELYSEEGAAAAATMEDDESEKQEGKALWLTSSTKLLIQLYRKYKPKLGHSHLIETKKKMWQQIANELKERGYVFTTSQIENKWKSLDRSYKANVKNNKATSRARSTCAFQNELTEVFSGNEAVFPSFVLNAHGPGQGMHTSTTNSNVDATDDSTEPFTSTPIRSSTPITPLLPKNQSKESLMTALLQKQEEQHVERMAQKAEELEAYKERTKAIQRKNELLEQLVLNAKNSSK